MLFHLGSSKIASFQKVVLSCSEAGNRGQDYFLSLLTLCNDNCVMDRDVIHITLYAVHVFAVVFAFASEKLVLFLSGAVKVVVLASWLES